MERLQAENGEEDHMLIDHDDNALDMHQFTDNGLMNEEAVSEGPVEHEAEFGGYPASDDASIYQSLRYENPFTYPEWLPQEEYEQRVDRRAQLFRPVVAVEPFLQAVDQQDQIASFANWHYQQYQMYANCMDQPPERGGLNNYLAIIAGRMEAFQTTQGSWETSNTFPELPTDKDLEESILTDEEYSANYEPALKQAYQSVEQRQQQPPSLRRTLVPKKAVVSRSGVLPFQPPARNPAASSTTAPVGSANSHDVMRGLDELIDGEKSGKGPKDSMNKNLTSNQPRAFSRNTSNHGSKDGSGEEIPKSTRSNSAEFKTAKLVLVENSLANSTALPRGISDDSTGKPTDTFRDPTKTSRPSESESSPSKHGSLPDRLKHLTRDMVDTIMDHRADLSKMKAAVRASRSDDYFDGISGLDSAKNVLKEMFIIPMLHPQLAKGLLTPPKGLLLFGPPGTGKTLIAQCVAAEVDMTFFSISAATLTSKWIGEGEKMMKATFEVARAHLPAIIFFDEVDALLSQRSDSEHDASRRIKTEFLAQFDGLNTDQEERLFVIGATNRPKEIDEAVRRRFTKRLYIPLPDKKARLNIVTQCLKTSLKNSISAAELDVIAERTEGFSGSDMKNICQDAARKMQDRLMPLNTITKKSRVPSFVITAADFDAALQTRNPSVDVSELQSYIDWNAKFGTGSR